MLKTMTATLLAASILVAPAFAAGAPKTAAMPKTEQSTQLKSDAAKTTTAKSAEVTPSEGKSRALNAKARMGRHHHQHRHHRYHRHHKRVTALHAPAKAKVSLKTVGSKVSFKSIRPAVKRG